MVPRASPGSIISSMHFTSAFKPSWISGECLPPPLRAVIGCVYLGMFLTLSSFFVSPQLCFVKRTQRLWSFHWNWEERKQTLKQEAFKRCWSLVFTVQSGPGATTLQKIKIKLKNWWAIRCSFFFFPFRLNGTLDFFVSFVPSLLLLIFRVHYIADTYSLKSHLKLLYIEVSRCGPMDKGAWWATVHGVARVGHDLATKWDGRTQFSMPRCLS